MWKKIVRSQLLQLKHIKCRSSLPTMCTYENGNTSEYTALGTLFHTFYCIRLLCDTVKVYWPYFAMVIKAFIHLQAGEILHNRINNLQAAVCIKKYFSLPGNYDAFNRNQCSLVRLVKRNQFSSCSLFLLFMALKATIAIVK